MSVKIKDQLSPSRMMKFMKCPRDFKYSQMELISPVMDTTAMTFGRVIHEAIKLYFETIPAVPERNNWKKIIKSTAISSLKRKWDGTLSSRTRTANTCIENFVRMEYMRYKAIYEARELDSFKPNVFEKDLYSKHFHAYPDFFYDGLLIDWKTNKKAELTEEYKLELWVQAEILDYHGYKTDDLRLGFLRHSKLLSCPKPEFSWLYEVKEKIKDAIQVDNFPPDKKYLCYWCKNKLRCDYDPSKDTYGEIFSISPMFNKSPFHKEIIPQRILFENIYGT